MTPEQLRHFIQDRYEKFFALIDVRQDTYSLVKKASAYLFISWHPGRQTDVRSGFWVASAACVVL